MDDQERAELRAVLKAAKHYLNAAPGSAEEGAALEALVLLIEEADKA